MTDRRSAFVITIGPQHPSGRLRIAAYQPALAERGWDLTIHPLLQGIGHNAPPPRSRLRRPFWHARRLSRRWALHRALQHLDSQTPIIVSRELAFGRESVLRLPNPLVVDLDDALHLGAGAEALRSLCERAEAVICGNALLAEAVSSFSRHVVVIPTVVDTGRIRPSTARRPPSGPVRLGWLGSSMSLPWTLAPLLPLLGEIRQDLAFELVVVSDPTSGPLELPPFVRIVPWSEAVELELGAQFDIGIMPLTDDPFQRFKCGAKLLHYMAAGLPAIATSAPANEDILAHGTTGFIVRTPSDWRAAIMRLATDETLRRSMGAQGRQRVERDYAVMGWADRFADVLSLAQRRSQ